MMTINHPGHRYFIFYQIRDNVTVVASHESHLLSLHQNFGQFFNRAVENDINLVTVLDSLQEWSANNFFEKKF